MILLPSAVYAVEGGSISPFSRTKCARPLDRQRFLTYNLFVRNLVIQEVFS